MSECAQIDCNVELLYKVDVIHPKFIGICITNGENHFEDIICKYSNWLKSWQFPKYILKIYIFIYLFMY